ncbi:MAG TPA: condensation domain-containing protein, partial [Polyangiaceae bacterium]
LPRTLNNKLDSRALLELDQAAPHEPPRTPTEIALAELWGQVLGRERVGAQDDFFALGGHSLAAVRLVARIRRSFGRELPLHVVFSQSVLADQAKELAALTAALDPIVPRRADDVHDIPLSLEQERLWFLWKLEPESVAYTVSGALRLEGELDEAALQSALGAIVGRHEILRTRFLDRAGVPRQVVVQTPAFAFTRHNLLESGAGELERRLNLANTEPFDLEGGPLLRARLLRCAAREHVLFLSVHHIVADGASIDLLLRELDLEYRAVRGDARLRPPALPIQYADYALWERNLGSDAKTDARLGFWRELLGTEHPSLELPVDRARRGARDGRGGRVLRTLAGPHIVALDRLSKRSGVTRFAILLAIFDVLLYRYSGQRDLRVGVPVSGRRHVETETLIGLFVNTWVLRLDVSPSDPFEQLMRRARAALASAEANQVPFARLVEALRPPRNTGESPLFRVTFNFEEAVGSGPALGDLRVSSVAIRDGGVPFDLMLDVVSGQDALDLSFGYARDLFDASTVERLVDDFVTILETVTNDSKTLVGAVPLSVPAQLSPSRSYSFRSLLDRFAEQVTLRPEAVALSFDGQSHTYRELDSWSNRIARRLRDGGASPEERVAICVDRSPAVVAAILGTLKAGAAYVPLDPQHPALRLRETLEDAGIARVLVDQRTSSELGKAWSGCEVIVVSDVDDASDEGWTETVLPEQLAYVIYTSGSTGKPK